VRAAYDFAEYLPERCRRMMQAWADYLDSLIVQKNFDYTLGPGLRDLEQA